MVLTAKDQEALGWGCFAVVCINL